MAHDMLHVICTQCVARDSHTIAPGPLERTCWRSMAIMIIIIIIVVVVVIIIIIVIVIVL